MQYIVSTYSPHYRRPIPTTIKEKIALCSRDRLVYILEEMGGIQCYESESKEVLSEALFVNIDDGTIPESVLETEE